jgi:GT2 family glycosyltransferase
MKWIDKCLQSLLQSSISVHTVVIDNASIDGSPAYISKHYPEVQLIETGKNLGFGKANNIGMRIAVEAGADYVFLLNQDAWVFEHTITRLVEIFLENPKYGILSPMHFTAEQNSFEKQFIAFLSDDYTNEFINDCYFQRLKTSYTTQYIHAAAWLIKATCLHKVGGFDPLFQHYGEDDDYMQRAKYFGFSLGIVTNSHFVHDAVYKTWELVEWNKNRNLILAYLQLKKMAPHFRSNFLVYLKMSFDELTTLLLFRKWKKLWFRFKILFTVLTHLKKIKQSHQLSFKEGSFL